MNKRFAFRFKAFYSVVLVFSAVLLILLLSSSPASAIKWIRASDMITNRTDLAIAQSGGKIYAIGGYYGLGGLGIMSLVEEFNPVTNHWREVRSMPDKRERHGAAGVNGKIYVFGGNWTKDYKDPTFVERCAPVQIYDPATNSWTTGSRMPTPRTDVEVAVRNDEVWVIGGSSGYDTNRELSAKVEIYNPASNTWRSGPSLPAPRFRHAATGTNGRIFVSGGVVQTNPVSKIESHDMYVSTGGGWIRLPDMPVGLVWHAMAGYQDKVFIIAGGDYNKSTDVLRNEVIVFDAVTRTYSSGGLLGEDRYHHAAVQSSNHVYVIGGSSDTPEWPAGNIVDNTETAVVDPCLPGDAKYELTVKVVSDGPGKVLNLPEVDCDAECMAMYCEGTSITLTAFQERGVKFRGWQGGDCPPTDPTCYLTMDGNKEVVANFACGEIVPPDLRVNNSDGPLVVPKGTPLILTLHHEPCKEVEGDYWLAVRHRGAYFSYDVTTKGWVPGLHPTFQGQLLRLNGLRVPTPNGIPTGRFTFYLAIDTVRDGLLTTGAMAYDKVTVDIR